MPSLSYLPADNSTLEIVNGVIRVKSAGITASQMLSATITGTQMASNINLPGNAVQENGKNIIASMANASTSLVIIRGWVNATGSITAGEGFTISKPSTGQYVINYSTAFSATPIVIPVCSTANFPAFAITCSPISTTQCGINTFLCPKPSTGLDSTFQDNDFMFVVIGPR